jgi:hypothetical protein
MCVKAVHENFHAVGLVVLVVIDEQAEVRLLRKINTLRRQLEADGQMQSARENGLLVRASVAVRVLEDEQLVVGPFRAALMLRLICRFTSTVLSSVSNPTAHQSKPSFGIRSKNTMCLS